MSRDFPRRLAEWFDKYLPDWRELPPDLQAVYHELKAWFDKEVDGLTVVQVEALSAWLECLPQEYIEQLLREGKLGDRTLPEHARWKAREYGPWHARPVIDGCAYDLGSYDTRDECMEAIRRFAEGLQVQKA